MSTTLRARYSKTGVPCAVSTLGVKSWAPERLLFRALCPVFACRARPNVSPRPGVAVRPSTFIMFADQQPDSEASPSSCSILPSGGRATTVPLLLRRRLRATTPGVPLVAWPPEALESGEARVLARASDLASLYESFSIDSDVAALPARSPAVQVGPASGQYGNG